MAQTYPSEQAGNDGHVTIITCLTPTYILLLQVVEIWIAPSIAREMLSHTRVKFMCL